MESFLRAPFKAKDLTRALWIDVQLLIPFFLLYIIIVFSLRKNGEKVSCSEEWVHCV